MNGKTMVTDKNAIYYILGISFFLRILISITSGDQMYLYSDDVGYLYSAINFIKSGHITYADPNYITVFGMPGMFVFLAGIFKIFGYGENGIFIARLIFDCLGVLTVYGVYLCTKIISKNFNIANLAALMTAISLPLICINNLFLTETPCLCLLIFLTYYLIKYSEYPTEKNFIILISIYIGCVLFKPVFGIYPLAFLPIFIYHKFSFQEIIKRGIFAGVALCICVAPWSIKNYCVTGEIIPLSGNQGDTLLVGSFDGIDVPAGTYAEAAQLAKTRAEEKEYEHPYFDYKEREIIGKERIKQWKETAPLSYYKSTYLIKPWRLISTLYYPKEMYGISLKYIFPIYNLQLVLAGLGLAYIIFYGKKYVQRFWYTISFILGSILIIYINSHYAAIARYGITNLLTVYIMSAFGVYFIWRIIKMALTRLGGIKSENFNLHSSLQ